MDDRRVADYFVVAGLDKNHQKLLDDAHGDDVKPASRDPITDITVINRSLGEKIPKGYECIEQTPTGYPANLNHGSLRCPDMFICFKRGRDKPPLKDLGILYEGKERVMEGCEVVSTTMEGHPANVNNSNSSRTYITFRRAEKSAPSDTLVVVDICIILGNRGEEPPLTFLKILKNLNKGMLGSDVYLCYKKAMVKSDVLAYNASVLGRYPLEDYHEFPLPQSVSMFCLPMGATIEVWAAGAQHPVPSFSTFILTGAGGEKVYGAAVSFYEEYNEENLSDQQMRTLGLKNRQIRQQLPILKTVHVRKAIALLSHWPFFDAFKKFLSQLYKISITGPHTVPMERHISHFMYDVPYPSPERPRILVQLTHDSLSLCMPEDSPLPQSGASFITMLRNLGPELTMNLLVFVLLETKILLHSLRPTVLTEVAEAVSTMIFPFHWQCPYIPLCPLGLSDVLNAPCPFIVGVDSRYFDLYDPPPDVVCVDLDTSRISQPEDKKSISFKLLPKKPTRVMQECLSRLYERASQPNIQKQASDEVSLEMTHFDLDFRRKKQDMQLELAIQEVFLRFTASLLKDYKNFLNPITKQPNSRTTDASSLFDMQGFLKSRDKTNTKFFSQMMRTQMFFRFIEERSFVSDKDASLAFFDECAEKVDESREEPRLIDIDNSQMSERTVFIMPPEPVGLPEGVKYSYNGFPELRQELFLTKKKSVLNIPSKQLCPNSPLARRTKQEVKSAQKVAQQQVGNPETWAKCLLSYCYSLWFVVFPAYVQAQPKKLDVLKVGFFVMKQMQAAKLITVDELCYRVLMQLAGQYNKPGLAVQVFSQMKKHGVQPNAITYGYYNKVMLEAIWPSPQSKGRLRWFKIRNVIIGVAQFRRAIRRRSISVYSNSGSEFDQISHTSTDSYLGDSQTQARLDATKTDTASSVVREASHVTDDVLNKNNGSLEERMSTGGVSDRGYNSMTQEDVKRLSQIVISTNDSGNISSTPASDNKSKLDSWNPLNFLVGSNVKARPHSDKIKKEVHIMEDKWKHHGHRPRVGSIVKRSISSAPSTLVDDFEKLKSSLLNNACGLVILSKACIERGSFLPDTDLRFQVEEAKRRRHRSAGEGPKPSRSMSLFASWRPPRLNGSSSDSDEQTKLTVNYSELMKKEEEGVTDTGSLTSKQNIDSVFEPACDAVSSGDASNTCMQSVPNVNGLTTSSNHSSHPPETNGNLSTSSPLLTINESDHPLDSTSTLYLEGGPVVKEPPHESSTVGDSSNSSSHRSKAEGQTKPSPPAQQVTTNKSQASGTDNCLPSDALQTSDASTNGQTDVNRREIRRSVSIPEDRLSGQFNESSIKQSLSETGNNLNSARVDQKTPVKTPVKHISEDSQSINSLTDSKKEGPSDFVLRRTQSLKKTNETIGSFFKLASKAAFTKLNELKQTITTPIKNGSLGSLGSLSQSVEELEGNDGSSTSGTIRERLRHGGSQELLSPSEESDTEDTDKRMSGVSFESAPSPSYLDDYNRFKDGTCSIATAISSSSEKLDDVIKVAMEVEMSSCSRCTKCNRLIYDEEIMAGWSAEDSNLNTSCPYCRAKFVPHLQVYIKDWRGDAKSLVFNNEQTYPIQEKLLANSDQPDGLAVSKFEGVGTTPVQDSIQSSLDRGDMPLTMEEAASTIRRRCTSECLSNVMDTTPFGSSMDSPPHTFHRSPLRLSIEEEAELGDGAQDNSVKKEFMSRSASSSEPVVVPYLSPLVLRKEVEYVLDHESNLCLASDSFVEDHPIIFWNLIWFFRRINVPTHLTGFLLTSKAFNCNKPEAYDKEKTTFTSRNVLIRPQWDNVRIHDEVGLPMYLAWRAGHKSTVVDALVIESDSFSRPMMWQIISSIKRNEVLAAIRAVADARRRMTSRKRRFRSMYREILFLSFAECGRENIDHDAFDREYGSAFTKLPTAEVRRLQLEDHPKSENIIWCRKVFAELEV